MTSALPKPACTTPPSQDLERFNSFFIDKEEDAVIELHALQEQLQQAKEPGQLQALKQAFVDFHGAAARCCCCCCCCCCMVAGGWYSAPPAVHSPQCQVALAARLRPLVTARVLADPAGCAAGVCAGHCALTVCSAELYKCMHACVCLMCPQELVL